MRTRQVWVWATRGWCGGGCLINLWVWKIWIPGGCLSGHGNPVFPPIHIYSSPQTCFQPQHWIENSLQQSQVKIFRWKRFNTFEVTADCWLLFIGLQGNIYYDRQDLSTNKQIFRAFSYKVHFLVEQYFLWNIHIKNDVLNKKSAQKIKFVYIICTVHTYMHRWAP